VAAPATAQVRPDPQASAFEAHRHQADRHRQEMERLRARADQRESFARQLETESRLSRLEIEAARQPDPIRPLPALRTPEEARAAREAAARRRASTAAAVGEIDDWLDRPRR